MILRIKNWADYQHYKDRSPPWIKLHYKILTSRDWVMSSDTERMLAIVCMLVASQSNATDGSFDADPEYIKRVAYLHQSPDFKSLIDKGFLEVVDIDASGCKQMLADDRKMYSETETELETELEKEGEGECEREMVAPIVATPSKIAFEFFSQPEKQQELVEVMTNEGADKSFADQQVRSFVDYWTELNKSGTKQRWQLEPTFEVQRRLKTWFDRAGKFGKSIERKGIRL